jgi:hypothetical protein
LFLGSSFPQGRSCFVTAERNENSAKRTKTGVAGTPLWQFIVNLARDSFSSSSGRQIIAMMQAAQPGHRYDFAIYA